MIPFLQYSRKDKIIGMESRSMIFRERKQDGGFTGKKQNEEILRESETVLYVLVKTRRIRKG